MMMHIIKWKSQPERQSLSWLATIKNARDEIADMQEETLSLTNEIIRSIWSKYFNSAKRIAEGEMNGESEIVELSWEEVFEYEYEII